MHKLNRKGYLTVEVILASVVAFLIAFFLFDITIKLVDTTDDAYVDTEILTDNALIMKNIQKNIQNSIDENGAISSVNCINSMRETYCSIQYLDKKYKINYTNRILSYHKVEIEGPVAHQRETLGDPLYSKELNENVSNVTISASLEGDYLFIKITEENIFSDKDNNINIIIYNG